jgi:hypothetical protein
LRERAFIVDVERYGDGSSSRGLDLIGNSASGRIIDIGRDDLYALLRKADRRSAADVPRRRASNDGYLVNPSALRRRAGTRSIECGRMARLPR